MVTDGRYIEMDILSWGIMTIYPTGYFVPFKLYPGGEFCILKSTRGITFTSKMYSTTQFSST